MYMYVHEYVCMYMRFKFLLPQYYTDFKSFGTKGTKEGQFTNPRGVAISHDGHILVQKLTFEGHCVKSVGKNKIGNGPLQFNNPISVTPADGMMIYHRIRDGITNRTNEVFFCHLQT